MRDRREGSSSELLRLGRATTEDDGWVDFKLLMMAENELAELKNASPGRSMFL